MMTQVETVVGALGTLYKGLEKDWWIWKPMEELQPFRQQHYLDWLETQNSPGYQTRIAATLTLEKNY